MTYKIYVVGGCVSIGQTAHLIFRDENGKEFPVHRKIYWNSHDGLYVKYKNKTYYEYEFNYVKMLKNENCEDMLDNRG